MSGSSRPTRARFQRLRAVAALCLALLAYGAIPHHHHDLDPAEATARLIADDHHESHSAPLAADEHPCTLCRDRDGRGLALAPSIQALVTLVRGQKPEPPTTAPRPELLFARRHPARGPPLS